MNLAKLAQIRTAVSEIFEEQTKNVTTDSAKTEPYLRAVTITMPQLNLSIAGFTYTVFQKNKATKLMTVTLSNLNQSYFIFTARRNARIASAVLATAIPSVCLSICLSVRPSVTCRYCVKTTARSTVQFALSDSKYV